MTYRLKADLPADPDERISVMAEGFRTALNHAANDPETRLRMVLGEAYAKLGEVVDWLRNELRNEHVDVRACAEKFEQMPELLAREIGRNSVASVQQKLLTLALQDEFDTRS